MYFCFKTLQVGGAEFACQCRRHGFNPWVRQIPWKREWLPTPVFLPGDFHGQRSLAGPGPWGHTESDTTEHAHTYPTSHIYSFCFGFFRQESCLSTFISMISSPENTYSSLLNPPLFGLVESVYLPLAWDRVAAAAAKSLQSCPTLCDPIDGSPPGSPIPGILQPRTLEWVAISFSNAWKWKVKGKLLSRVWLGATPWTAAHQDPPSMGLSRQEYWSGVPLPGVG